MLDTTSPDGQTDEAERDTGNGDPASHVPDQTGSDFEPSLGDDLSALVDDGKAYVEAELQFQKSRAAFAGGEAKAGAVFAFAMLAFLHLALMGLVIGLIFALAPMLGGFVATAIVVGTLLLFTALFGWLAVSRFKKIGRAFDDGDTPS